MHKVSIIANRLGIPQIQIGRKPLLACNASQGSAAHACRARCDEAVYECLNRKCIGQSCPQQCGPTHSACLLIKSAGC